jgi:hypothetical protein
VTLPLHERINLLAKTLTRHIHGDYVDLLALSSQMYALAKEVEERGAFTEEQVHRAVFDTYCHMKEISMQSDAKTDVCEYDSESVADDVLERLGGGDRT